MTCAIAQCNIFHILSVLQLLFLLLSPSWLLLFSLASSLSSLLLLLFLLPAVIQFFQQMKAGTAWVFCVQIILFVALLNLSIGNKNIILQPQNVHHQSTLASPLHVGQMLNAERGMVQVHVLVCLATKVTHMIREAVGVSVKWTQTALKF